MEILMKKSIERNESFTSRCLPILMKLEKNPDLNAVNDFGENILHCAVYSVSMARNAHDERKAEVDEPACAYFEGCGVLCFPECRRQPDAPLPESGCVRELLHQHAGHAHGGYSPIRHHRCRSYRCYLQQHQRCGRIYQFKHHHEVIK